MSSRLPGETTSGVGLMTEISTTFDQANPLTRRMRDSVVRSQRRSASVRASTMPCAKCPS